MSVLTVLPMRIIENLVISSDYSDFATYSVRYFLYGKGIFFRSSLPLTIHYKEKTHEKSMVRLGRPIIRL